MSTQWLQKAVSILVQMYFTVVSEDNGFVLTSAELKINKACVNSLFYSEQEWNMDVVQL